MTYQTSPPCLKCSGKAQPGTVATLTYLIARFPGTSSLGIYNCRTVAGKTVLSKHSCGRAFDLKIPILSNGRADITIGNPIIRFLYENSTFLGLEELIYNRIIYDAKNPGGRTYTGVHPHDDHIHGAQTLAKAQSLTMSQLVAQLGPVTSIPTPKPPTPTPPTDWTQKIIMALPTLRKGDGLTPKVKMGPDVKRLQGLLIANGFEDKKSANPKTGVDGKFGPGTETAVKAFQKAKKLASDGIVGKNTWTKLLGE